MLIATMIGTPAFFACEIASIVCGITESSAATTSTTMSVTCAPRARMAVNASWPGVSRNVTCLPFGVVTWYAPMCCVMPPASPATTLALRMKSSSDVLPWSTWPMIVTTGGRETQRFRRVGDGLHRGGGVFLFLLRVEAELARDELDLVEVEALIDRDHQPEILERERHDLRGRHLQDLGQLAHGDELVDADELLLDLGRGGAHRLDFFARAVVARAATLRSGAAHLAHGARDVRRHRLLVHLAALALLASTGRRRGRTHAARSPTGHRHRDGGRRDARRRLRCRCRAWRTRRDAAGTAIRS